MVSRKTDSSAEKSEELADDNGDHVVKDKAAISSPVSHLWASEDGVTPLLRPEDAVSTGVFYLCHWFNP